MNRENEYIILERPGIGELDCVGIHTSELDAEHARIISEMCSKIDGKDVYIALMYESLAVGDDSDWAEIESFEYGAYSESIIKAALEGDDELIDELHEKSEESGLVRRLMIDAGEGITIPPYELLREPLFDGLKKACSEAEFGDLVELYDLTIGEYKLVKDLLLS